MGISCDSVPNRTEALSQGERRLAAIMFTDMAGFTSMSQKDKALAIELLEEKRGALWLS
jgi:class 3 adenylate cyclase